MFSLRVQAKKKKRLWSLTSSTKQSVPSLPLPHPLHMSLLSPTAFDDKSVVSSAYSSPSDSSHPVVPVLVLRHVEITHSPHDDHERREGERRIERANSCSATILLSSGSNDPGERRENSKGKEREIRVDAREGGVRRVVGGTPGGMGAASKVGVKNGPRLEKEASVASKLSLLEIGELFLGPLIHESTQLNYPPSAVDESIQLWMAASSKFLSRQPSSLGSNRTNDTVLVHPTANQPRRAQPPAPSISSSTSSSEFQRRPPRSPTNTTESASTPPPQPKKKKQKKSRKSKTAESGGKTPSKVRLGAFFSRSAPTSPRSGSSPTPRNVTRESSNSTTNERARAEEGRRSLSFSVPCLSNIDPVGGRAAMSSSEEERSDWELVISPPMRLGRRSESSTRPPVSSKSLPCSPSPRKLYRRPRVDPLEGWVEVSKTGSMRRNGYVSECKGGIQ